MTNKFEVEDPRGRTVICTEDCWTWHILDFHPKMEGLENLVIDAIENPDFGLIYRDTDSEKRDIYYRRPPGKSMSIKVVVEFDEDQRGEVITAFRVASPKAGEKIIWPELNQ